jgi:hypothetical protein
MTRRRLPSAAEVSYRRPMRSAIRSIALLMLCLPAVSRAQVSVGQPQLFTIEAILAPDQATADKVGYDPLSIGFQGGSAGDVRWIGVVAARSLQGDSFQGKTVVEGLLPKTPNLLVDGPAEIVSKLRAAQNGSRVVLQGILSPPTRIYMLDKVDVLAAPAGN